MRNLKTSSLLEYTTLYGFWYHPKTNKMVPVANHWGHTEAALKLVPKKDHKKDLYAVLFNTGWVRGVVVYGGRKFNLQYVSNQKPSKKQAEHLVLDIIDKLKLNTWPDTIFVDTVKVRSDLMTYTFTASATFDTKYNESLNEVLAQDDEGWVLKSKKTGRVLRRWPKKPSDKEVAKAEKEIQYFKQLNKNENLNESTPYGFWYNTKTRKIVVVQGQGGHFNVGHKMLTTSHKDPRYKYVPKFDSTKSLGTDKTGDVYYLLFSKNWVRGILNPYANEINIEIVGKQSKKKILDLVADIVDKMKLNWWPKRAVVDFIKLDSKDINILHISDASFDLTEAVLNEASPYGFWYYPKTKKVYAVPNAFDHAKVGKKIDPPELRDGDFRLSEYPFEMIKQGWVRGVIEGREGYALNILNKLTKKQAENIVLEVVDQLNLSSYPDNILYDIMTPYKLGIKRLRSGKYSFNENNQSHVDNLIDDRLLDLTEALLYGVWYNPKTKDLLKVIGNSANHGNVAEKYLKTKFPAFMKNDPEIEDIYTKMFELGFYRGAIDRMGEELSLQTSVRSFTKTSTWDLAMDLVDLLDLKYTPKRIYTDYVKAETWDDAGQSKIFVYESFNESNILTESVPYGFWYHPKKKKAVAVPNFMGHDNVARTILGVSGMDHEFDAYIDMYAKGWVRGVFSQRSNIAAIQTYWKLLNRKDAQNLLLDVLGSLNINFWPRSIVVDTYDDPRKTKTYTTDINEENLKEATPYGFWFHPKTNKIIPVRNNYGHMDVAMKMMPKGNLKNPYNVLFGQGWVRGAISSSGDKFNLQYSSKARPNKKEVENIILDVIEKMDLQRWPSQAYVDILKVSKDGDVEHAMGSSTFDLRMTEKSLEIRDINIDILIEQKIYNY